MRNTIFLFMLNRVLVSFAFFVCSGACGSAATPNIVLILSDDYGYGSATCYGAV